MIKLTVADDARGHFLVQADEPMRIEVDTVDGKVIAHVYKGVEIDMEQPPAFAFDGYEGGNEDVTV